MKFEELPEDVQMLAAETLSSVIKTYWMNDIESYTLAADHIREAFKALYSEPLAEQPILVSAELKKAAVDLTEANITFLKSLSLTDNLK